MGAIKLSISIDERQLGWLRREAKSGKTTVSAVLSEALADLRRSRERERLIRRLGGKLTLSPREVREIQAEWDAD